MNIQNLWFYLSRRIIYNQNDDLYFMTFGTLTHPMVLVVTSWIFDRVTPEIDSNKATRACHHENHDYCRSVPLFCRNYSVFGFMMMMIIMIVNRWEFISSLSDKHLLKNTLGSKTLFLKLGSLISVTIFWELFNK